MTFIGAPFGVRTAGGFSFGQWIANPTGDAVKRHEHLEAHLMFIVAGDYVSDAAGPSRSRLVYNPPNTVHRDRFESAGSFFAISIPPMDDVTLPLMPTKIEHEGPQALIRRLMREDADAESLCYEIVGSVVPQRPGATSWLRRAREILSDRYAEPITIRDVSREVGVHPIHLARTFRAAFACTPGEYLRARRVEKAAEMLVASDRSLTEIAFECGFADQSHMTKQFQRAFRTTPGEYRRSGQLVAGGP